MGGPERDQAHEVAQCLVDPSPLLPRTALVFTVANLVEENLYLVLIVFAVKHLFAY